MTLTAGEVRVEASPVGPVAYPPGPFGPVILYLHGGRYLTGTPESALGVAGDLAVRTGAAVVCCRYRQAFPAALDDVHAGFRYGQALGPVMLAGERLGAGLAAALLVRLRDAGARLRDGGGGLRDGGGGMPGGAVLVSALLDLSLQAPSLLLNAAADAAFRAAELRRQVERYAAGTALTDPLLSPLHANLHGLPPVQLLAAGNDVLLDDSMAFATRAARSGVTVDLRVWPDATALRLGAIGAMAAFLTERTRTAQSA
jgi:epsilon-lactone hydrolase